MGFLYRRDRLEGSGFETASYCTGGFQKRNIYLWRWTLMDTFIRSTMDICGKKVRKAMISRLTQEQNWYVARRTMSLLQRGKMGNFFILV